PDQDWAWAGSVANVAAATKITMNNRTNDEELGIEHLLISYPVISYPDLIDAALGAAVETSQKHNNPEPSKPFDFLGRLPAAARYVMRLEDVPLVDNVGRTL